MKKRGVELSMNVIIIAAIALIVLVILILLVTRSAKTVGDGTGCKAKSGGACVAAAAGTDPCSTMNPAKTRFPGSDCPTNQVCCVNSLV